jgi:hypothetical protein
MEKKLASNKKNSFFDEITLRKGLEIYSNKIQPQLETRILHNYSKEDEWEQEYYIIYNSYVLEDKDSES